MKNRLRALRKEKHYSQVRLQIKLGIEQSDISKIESEKKSLTPENCKLIALFFNTSMDYIVYFTNERLPHSRSSAPFSQTHLMKRMGEIASLRKQYFIQSDIAEIIGINQSNFSKIELGKRYFSLEQYKQLALHLNTSIDYICGLTDDSTPYIR